MRTLIGKALAILLLLGLGIGQGSSLALRSIRGDVFNEGHERKTCRFVRDTHCPSRAHN